MATRVSPRSNASSASSSSSASRRPYRNPSFNRDRDNSDPWLNDGRGVYPGKQQHLHQQHNKGQWGHKSGQASRAWGNSGKQIFEKNEDSRSSWRSQKHAVDNYSTCLDSGPPRGNQKPYRGYEASPYPSQGQIPLDTVKGNWNQGSPREQIYYPDQRRHALYSEQSPREREQFHSGKATYGQTASAANINYSSCEGRGANNSLHQGFRNDSLIRSSQGSDQLARNDSVNRNSKGPGGYPAITSQRPGGYSSTSSQGSRYAPGKYSSHGTLGDAAESSADVTNRVWESSMAKRHEARIDEFPPLTGSGGPGPRNVGAVGMPVSATNRVWGGVIIGSWADECSDDAPRTSSTEEIGSRGSAISGISYKPDWDGSDASGTRRPGASINNQSVPLSDVNRDTWRQNSWQGSNAASAGANVRPVSRNSWKNQESNVRHGEATRKATFAGRHGSFKHTMPTMSEERVRASGENHKSAVTTPNHINHAGHDSKEGAMRAPDDQIVFAQGDIEGLDDTMLPFIMGTCEDMCPLKEREQRERLRDLAVFERVNGNSSKTTRELAVKKFCRTFSGGKLLSADVRPLRILWSTLQYLLNLLDDSEYSFDVVHNFLFDRTRAIRQELGMQRIANSQAINMYEEIVRFHILSEHELNQRGSGRHVSDSHLNLQQLSKSLLSLFELYHFNHQEKVANEAEFRAYYVLLNLDSNNHHQADSLSVWFRQCPAHLLKSWELKFARAVLRCYRSGNYRSFFQMAQEATFLQSCLMELHFNEVRLKGLAAMNQGGYKLHPIPLAEIAKQLLLKEGDLEELCNLCGLATGMDASRVRCLLVKQSQFSAPKELPSYRCSCIVNKKPASYYEEVTGSKQRL